MIFISYRRTDSADVAGRIYDRLTSAFGETNVFKDVDNMPVGTDFAEHIRNVIPTCKVFMALVGPTWLDVRDTFGNRRIGQADDLVRIEIERALLTPNLVVIPVLVGHAELPKESELPSSIRGLVAKNAASVRQDPDFNRDISRLIEGVRRALDRKVVNTGSEISVLGIGGAGTNAVNRISQLSFEGTDFAVLDSDHVSLGRSRVDTVKLGSTALVRAATPAQAAQAARQNREKICQRLERTALLLVAAGLGGATGTGVAPVIAEFARDLGISTVGVFTLPFDFEGQQRSAIAKEAVERLRRQFDSLIILENQRLFALATKDTTFAEAFDIADSAIVSSLRSVVDLVAKGSLANVDTRHLADFIAGMGPCSIVRGEIEYGADVDEIVQSAFKNPILTSSKIARAPRAILNIRGGSELRWSQVDAVLRAVRSTMSIDAKLLTGTRATAGSSTKLEFSILGMNSAP